MSKKSKFDLSASVRKRVLKENDPKRVSKGEDMYGYGEQKKPCNLSLTPSAIDILERAAIADRLSKSEFIEQWLRTEVAKTITK